MIHIKYIYIYIYIIHHIYIYISYIYIYNTSYIYIYIYETETVTSDYVILKTYSFLEIISFDFEILWISSQPIVQ